MRILLRQSCRVIMHTNKRKKRQKPRQLVRRIIGKLHSLRKNTVENMTREKEMKREEKKGKYPKCPVPQPAVYSELSQIQGCP